MDTEERPTEEEVAEALYDDRYGPYQWSYASHEDRLKYLRKARKWRAVLRLYVEASK